LVVAVIKNIREQISSTCSINIIFCQQNYASFVSTKMRIVLTISSILLLARTSDAFQPTISSLFGATKLQSSTSSFSSALYSSENGFDFDVAIIGCGVGGHGAALHSRGQQLNTAVFAGGDVGGTCVNRGCVPSKALLAASGRVRDMRNSEHLQSLGITVEGNVQYDRSGIAAHAKNLANRVKGNLEASLTGLGVNVIEGRGILTGKPHEVKDELTGKIYTAKVRITFTSFVF
jgi:Pyridine nucleotide-disulphide oxidoreductase